MSETHNASSEASGNKAHVDWFCDWVRQGAEHAADMLTPPESVGKHFRESRIEFLRGVRGLIDYQIERLSRSGGKKGTRVVVE